MQDFKNSDNIEIIKKWTERSIKVEQELDAKLELVSKPDKKILDFLAKNHAPSPGKARLSAEDFRQKLKQAENGLLLMLYEKGEPIGFYLSRHENGLREETYSCDGLAVAEQYKNKGLGAVLLRTGLRFAQELSFKRVVLFCEPVMEDFYKKFGFHKYKGSGKEIAMCAYL